MNDALETKLAAARTRLILDKPFLGALVLRLPMVAADPEWCATTATDARKFYYNAEYIETLDLEQTQFMLAHEALHCALSHFARRQHRIKFRWDLACDYAINPLLLREGLKPPPTANIIMDYEGMTAEEIYPLIDDNDSDQPIDRHAYDENDAQDRGQGNTPDHRGDGGEQEKDEENQGSNQAKPEAEIAPNSGGASQPPPLNHEERDNLSVQWQQRMAGAAQQAQQAGKLGDTLSRLVEHLLQPQLPWRTLLAHYMSVNARDDYSYMRPSRREGSAILPSLRSHQLEVVIALDISGSIGEKELKEFTAEVDALKGQLRARITLLACDAALDNHGPWSYEPWEVFELPKQFVGGGGTNFVPVFDWVNRCDTAPDLLIYFTDAAGEFPKAMPTYPVLWLIKGKNKVPWGQRIQLN